MPARTETHPINNSTVLPKTKLEIKNKDFLSIYKIIYQELQLLFEIKLCLSLVYLFCLM